MTLARDLPPVNTQSSRGDTVTSTDNICELNRKRSLLSELFERYLQGSSCQQPGASGADDTDVLADFFKGTQTTSGLEAINDLPGVFNARTPAAIELSRLETSGIGIFEAAHLLDNSAEKPAAAAAGLPFHHRAIVTSMPMPAVGHTDTDQRDDDTSSVATLPMPSRKRRHIEDDDEACSSPNDLVELPAAQPCAGRKRQHVAPASAARTAISPDASSVRRDQSHSSPGNTAIAASPDVKKGILVAKVLTKSDSNSKRVILPRIAVETNLPQLALSPHFHFSATDPSGVSWPLVIKAWANGSNPKPVYVMEMIGDVLKLHRLAIGDAIALLADEEGSFYLEWNTSAAHAAAARPTYSGIVFQGKDLSSCRNDESHNQHKQHKQCVKLQAPQLELPHPAQQEDVTPLVHTPEAAESDAVQLPARSPFAEAISPSRTTHAVCSVHTYMSADAAAAAASELQQDIGREGSLNVALDVDSVAPVTASQQQQLFQELPVSMNMPLMTAVPVTSPQVRGTFIPTSPCQLLVVGHLPIPELDLDLEACSPSGLQPSLPSGMLVDMNSSGDVVMPAVQNAFASGLEPASASDEALLVPTGATPQLAHAGGVLLCPRTPGCTRPAGHQGWCLGHKGYKKRRLTSPALLTQQQ